MKQYYIHLIYILSFGLFAQENTEAFRLENLNYPEMVLVEGGAFNMGDEWVFGEGDELPVHEVVVKNYYISITEVTVKQYRQFCQETYRQMPEAPSWGWKDNNPIVNVSWYDAVAYCDWLGDKMEKFYRLPTEAEWEYAARGGKNSKGFKYSGGQTMQNLGWFDENSNKRTQAVAVKKTNELGIYDMSGNVWEWCLDMYDYEYYTYYSSDSDPRGPLSGRGRTLRGGSWSTDVSYCRVTDRNHIEPEYRSSKGGFRVVFSK